MAFKLALMLCMTVLSVSTVGSEYTCYWNRQCPYQLYSSKTTYDAVRGDIRDHAKIENCQPISLWSLHRHGNRNPGSSVTAAIKVIAGLKDQIITSHEEGNSQLCAQDIEEFRKWTWNETLEVSSSFLTGIGYEELYDIGSRIRQKYPELLEGAADDFYFRPTTEQRTITSAIAYVHGLTDGTNLTLTIDDPMERDDVIRPYENCDKYQGDVKEGFAVENAVNEYSSTEEYLAILPAVQQRLGIPYQLTSEDIYSFYELCRFDRSWNAKLRSPWCSVFTDDELTVLEYKDDVRHYYRNGYGSMVNVNLGKPALKDLYDNFLAATQDKGRKMTAYFTHDTMMEMVYCALGLYKDDTALEGSIRDDGRKWRSSYSGSMAANIMAILNRCNESGADTYRVQIFNSERVTDLCPLNGCTWEDFQDKFQEYSFDLDFCRLNASTDSLESNGGVVGKSYWTVVISFILVCCNYFI